MKEMKEKYIKPVTEIVVFEQEDVVTASDGGGEKKLETTGFDW